MNGRGEDVIEFLVLLAISQVNIAFSIPIFMAVGIEKMFFVIAELFLICVLAGYVMMEEPEKRSDGSGSP